MAVKSEPTEYCYVDARHVTQNNVQSPWSRIKVDEITKYQQESAGNYAVFATVQMYAAPTRKKGEAYIAPLFFDLDSPDVAISQTDAVKLIDFLTKELDVQPTDMRIYFSGSKGFHIIIHQKAVGILPATNTHKVMKHLSGYLIHRLELTTMDLVVYTDARMLRLPNSVHEKTKLFKTELSIEEITTLTVEDIKELASRPRINPVFTPEERFECLALRGKTSYFYNNKLKEYLQSLASTSDRYKDDTYIFKKGQHPACVIDILENGWKKDGDRNPATIQLASYFKAAGYTKLEALTALEPWVTKFTSASSGYQVDQRIANTRGATDAVYSSSENYRFGCAFIRSLHGDRKPGQKDYVRVKCAGDLCPCLMEPEADEEIATLHLASTGSADLTGKLIKTRVMIAGKKQTPYIIPKSVEYHCWGWKTCKKTHCPLFDLDTHTGYKNLKSTNRELIQMTSSDDSTIDKILKELSDIPDCKRFNIEVVETINVDELLVIPMADAEDDDKAGRYVLRRIYSCGELNIDENKYYEICGYVYPHPRNQEGTILLKSAKPLQDVVESFQLTNDVKEQLNIFRPAGEDYGPEAIDTKLSQICSDLTYNVTHIVERDDTLLGVLLVQHSVLRLSVPWDTNPIRGWLELMVLGDTGTGKSALIEKMMRFSGLGSRINAESTSRTGLTYKMEQSGPGGAWYIVWGAWPLADKELVWVDEATGITKEQYGEMTQARSDGKLEVKRAVTAETPCRVRAILSSNVAKGKRISDYTHGAEALKDIFNNEDIRRFDFGIFMKTTDVDAEKYNKILGTYPKSITADALKNNILFSWSRTPDQVVFPLDTIEEILRVSTALSKIYGMAAEVPLVSPSDQRNKVARLSSALAALTHSVDDSGEKIVVYPGHVQYIEAYLKLIYNAPGCGLNFLSQMSVKEEELTPKSYERLSKKLRELPVLKEDGLYREFVNLFAKQRYLGVKDVEELLNITKDQAKSVTTFLARNNMVIKTSGGLRKTPLFNSYVQMCFAEGMFDDNRDD